MPSKRVQEMVLSGEEPQRPYICRDDCTDEDVSVPPSLLPIIDLSLLSSLKPSTALDKIRLVAREFFEQPMEEKIKYAKGVEEFEGHGADPVPAEGQSLDWSDRLFRDVYQEDRRKPKLWPKNPKFFKNVSKAMAKSLNLEEYCFADQVGLVLGLKAHAEGSGYTIILQDDVEGLQVLKDKNWITVPTISDALLILMGDQMERERISVAVFYTPEPKKEIGPEEGSINGERPRIFNKVKDYAEVHWEYCKQGKRALHVARV
ncbi:hypothetical protein P3X46_010835 [Hevea brasiliensis]|uniref:Non-haem dioxygenase N-terminal domain-containing protein n=1 Tax=Hevea brasiliensis TaxID=3981 RepID=A0ABQ9MI15_HEVBR|nr:hypothetical protein P3X46_010835 [Hevea brasiliensis]